MGVRYALIMLSVININPNILGGTPVFSGTRVPVKSLYDYLKHDYSIDEFLEAFPTVTRAQVEQLLDELERITCSMERQIR
jgi:uncharacterized protein (DUF433 family)